MELHVVANWMVTYYKIFFSVVIDKILPKNYIFYPLEVL